MNKELQEQIECLNLKKETITTPCQAMQEDCNKNKFINKDLEDQVTIIKSARDDMVAQI